MIIHMILKFYVLKYLAVITEREEKLKDLLKTSRTLEQIVAACIVYGRPREPKTFFELGERGHMKKHLEKLMKEGLVVKDGEYYIVPERKVPIYPVCSGEVS